MTVCFRESIIFPILTVILPLERQPEKLNVTPLKITANIYYWPS